jgi:hypothetical protein
MKKWLIILLSILTLSFLAGCNLETKNDTTAKTNTWDNTTLKIDKVTIYIDKNCENAQIPQCNPKTWQLQLWQLVGTGLEIKYITKDNIEQIKKLSPTTPVLAIPESKLSLFGQQATSIKTQAKNENGVYYLPVFSWVAGEENLCNDGKDNNGDGKVDAQDPSCYKMTILTSDKCKEQYCNPMMLWQMFMGYAVKVLDIHTDEGKKLYDELKNVNKEQYLPTFLFDKQKDYLKNLSKFIKEVNLSWYKYQLNVPEFKYDPSIEACATDCNASPSCKKLLTCNKTDKPNVDLYVMSYCPFGTQAEKGILQAANTLKWKINFNVKLA